eukprot:COSAG01_NODE_1137_length_11546_cov_14.463091_8_plen_72_part_00
MRSLSYHVASGRPAFDWNVPLPPPVLGKNLRGGGCAAAGNDRMRSAMQSRANKRDAANKTTALMQDKYKKR